MHTSPDIEQNASLSPQADSVSPMRVLVTGATGYVGGRLVPRLLEAGYAVRCIVRSPEKLRDRPWHAHARLEIVTGDLSDPAVLKQQLDGCDVAYYLIHSMVAAGTEYADRDREMAKRFAGAAEQAGLKRIIYLGGLGELGAGLSEHLESRREVETALASGKTPLTVLRAAMIIGAGSVSFEILRYLVERLPVMITPRWVSTESQPIGITNVLGYLIDCLRVPETAGRILDIGGADVMSYRQIMEIMAELRELPRRWVIPVPVLTPRLSSLWIQFVTPIDRRIARPLAEGLRNRVVCRNDDAARLMPQRLLGVREAIAAALTQLDQADVETMWSGAGEMPGDPNWSGGTVFTDRRTIQINASAQAVFAAICRVGGGNGWYAADWLWRVRGAMDRLIGGPGLRRGRRDPNRIAFGEALDFWRVIGVEADRLLRLRAEMKLPGEAVLEFEIQAGESPAHAASVCLVQTARFRPRGLLGLLYWYAVLPLHGIVFKGMLQGIRRTAEQPVTPQRVRVVDA
ncbi:SDR family oxidoreductase [soil metagenome]